MLVLIGASGALLTPENLVFYLKQAGLILLNEPGLTADVEITSLFTLMASSLLLLPPSPGSCPVGASGSRPPAGGVAAAPRRVAGGGAGGADRPLSLLRGNRGPSVLPPAPLNPSAAPICLELRCTPHGARLGHEDALTRGTLLLRPSRGWPRWLGTRWFLALITVVIAAADQFSLLPCGAELSYFFPCCWWWSAAPAGRCDSPALCCLLTLQHAAAGRASPSLRLPHLASRLLVLWPLLVTTELGLRNRRLRGNQQALEVRLAQADLRQDLIATLAHDLKTPVLGCLASARMMLQELDPAEAGLQRRGLAAILSSQNRCLRLIEDLLQVFRADLEGLPLQLAPLEILPLVQETLEDLRPLPRNGRSAWSCRGASAWADAPGWGTLTWCAAPDREPAAECHRPFAAAADGGAPPGGADQELRLQVLDRGSGFRSPPSPPVRSLLPGGSGPPRQRPGPLPLPPDRRSPRGQPHGGKPSGGWGFLPGASAPGGAIVGIAHVHDPCGFC